jgi:uncharacterized repeat protein (TIGR03803 family)
MTNRRPFRVLPGFIAGALLLALPALAGEADGDHPLAKLHLDRDGNLYGTTVGGGNGQGSHAHGAIFKIAPDGTETLLHVFGDNDGAQPMAGLISDKDGNLYGTAAKGGGKHWGTVFKLAPDGTFTVLHRFKARNDGAHPTAPLLRDAEGDIFGTTQWGGNAGGAGTVFEITAAGKEKILHAFSYNGSDGIYPYGGLIADRSGNLYGTTDTNELGAGTVFKIAPDGTETVIYNFHGKPDGVGPVTGLYADKNGNMYGTTVAGGTYGYGTVFRVTPDGSEEIVYSFAAGADGLTPASVLIADGDGNLYGTTLRGGTGPCSDNVGTGCGTVFKVTPAGVETVIYRFAGGSDGANPWSGLVMDSAGNLFGTTAHGGNGTGEGQGTVFKIAPDGSETVLHRFDYQR